MHLTNFASWGLALLVAALASPWLLASATVPDAVFAHQALAVAAWGAWLIAYRPVSGTGWRGLATPDRAAPVAWALALAGGASVLVALIQYFAPALADGVLVAATTSPGRAVGNMRQPNHLATLLLCAMVWTAWLWQAGRLPPRLAGAAVVAMVLALVLSASRTGALSLAVLLLWAWADRSLPRAARWTLAATPLVYALAWAALAAWAALDHGSFYAAERLQAGGDMSSSRFAIWRNALALLAQQPWAGVGWGHFNAAWTFTPFPDRPVAFFDHTHNLPLQLAVELGLPAALALLGLGAWALWRARGAWQAVQREPAHPARAALAMLAVLGVHSLLEYPLWYAYFLLPAAWAFGVLVGGAAPAVAPAEAASARRGWPLRLAGALMIAGAAYAAWDHRRVEVIFAPPAGAGPLAERIAEGRKSRLFGHHADYAAVTTEPRDQRLESFARPLRRLVDTRLLVAYIEALRANGREAEALYAAQRLREFRRPDAQAWFKDCTPDNPAPPFQCNTRAVALTWRDVLP